MKSFDLHCDTATECMEKHTGLYSNDFNISLERVKKYDRWAQVFACFIKDEYRGEAAYRYFNEMSDCIIGEWEKNKAIISFCRSGKDLAQAEKDGKNIAMLSIEGGAAIAGKLDYLGKVYEKGVRIMTLTWNGRNEIADGAGEEEGLGLTPFGFETVKEMNRLGMVVDVSHLSEKGFWDVARTGKKPFIATHSDSKKLCDHRRNLTDDQFREIAQGGGLVGLNYFTDFLGGTKDVNAIADHAEHFLELGGEKVIALGSDFDGCKLAEGITGVQDLDRLYGVMVSRFGLSLADDIFYNNAFRFFTENLAG